MPLHDRAPAEPTITDDMVGERFYYPQFAKLGVTLISLAVLMGYAIGWRWFYRVSVMACFDLTHGSNWDYAFERCDKPAQWITLLIMAIIAAFGFGLTLMIDQHCLQRYHQGHRQPAPTTNQIWTLRLTLLAAGLLVYSYGAVELNAALGLLRTGNMLDLVLTH